MLAQRRPLPPSPASDDGSDGCVRVAVRHAAASRGGVGGPREMGGEASARQEREAPREPRDGDPDDDEGGGGGGGDGSDSDRDSSLSAGSMEESSTIHGVVAEAPKSPACPTS